MPVNGEDAFNICGHSLLSLLEMRWKSRMCKVMLALNSAKTAIQCTNTFHCLSNPLSVYIRILQLKTQKKLAKLTSSHYARILLCFQSLQPRNQHKLSSAQDCCSQRGNIQEADHIMPGKISPQHVFWDNCSWKMPMRIVTSLSNLSYVALFM